MTPHEMQTLLWRQQQVVPSLGEVISPSYGGAGPGGQPYTLGSTTYTPTDANTEKGKSSMMKSIKEYLSEHRNVLFNIGLILLIDHFVFNGAFREKIKSIMEGLINKVTKQLGGEEK